MDPSGACFGGEEGEMTVVMSFLRCIIRIRERTEATDRLGLSAFKPGLADV